MIFRTSELAVRPLPNLGTPAPPAPSVPSVSPCEISAPLAPAAPSPASPAPAPVRMTAAEALAAHEGLIIFHARRSGVWRRYPEDREDVLQEMRIGFARAWDRADPARPEHQALAWCILHARRAAWHWHRARRAQCRIQDPMSIDAPIEGGTSLAEVMPGSGAAPSPCAAAECADAMDALADRERHIVKRIYFGQETMQEIGNTLNITRARIQQIHAAAIAAMRRRIFNHG
jgi:RNA polymerase sigma factor (sigma-70 family)